MDKNRLVDVEAQLALLHKKLAHFEREEIVTADAGQKFAVREKIAETRAAIAAKEAERAALTGTPSASVTEPSPSPGAQNVGVNAPTGHLFNIQNVYGNVTAGGAETPPPAAPPGDARKRGWKLAVAGGIVLVGLATVVLVFVAIWKIVGKEPPGRMLVRTVVDGETWRPVAGARIWLRDVVPRVETKTDAAGKFQLEYPPGEDESRVEIEKDGYCPVDEYVSLRDPDKPFELRRATRGCGR